MGYINRIKNENGCICRIESCKITILNPLDIDINKMFL